MVLVETNITYGTQFCSTIVGAFMGEALVLLWIGRILTLGLGFYAIKKTYDYFNNRRIARGY